MDFEEATWGKQSSQQFRARVKADPELTSLLLLLTQWTRKCLNQKAIVKRRNLAVMIEKPLKLKSCLKVFPKSYMTRS